MVGGVGVSATPAGGNVVDIAVSINLHNLADISKIGGRVNAEVAGITKQFKKMGKQVGNVSVKIKSMDKSVNALGNQMGFVAFQWMFISGIAGRTLQQIRRIATEIVEAGAKGTTGIIRAIATTRKLGESTEEAAMRGKASFNFIMEMARRTGIETTSVAESFKEVGKALKDVNQTIPVTAQVLRMMVVEEIDAGQAAKGFIGILNNYSDTITSVEEVTRTLLGVNMQSRVSLGELTHAFEFSAATASDFGLTIQETGTLLGIMGDQLTPGRIGRQFARLLEEVRSASLKLGPTMEAMGVNIYDAQGNMKNFPDVLRAIAEGANNAGKQGDIFRDKFLDMMKLDSVAKRALLGIMDDMDKYDDALKELTSPEMTALLEKQWREFTNTPEANLNKLKVVTEQLKMELVGGLAPALATLTNEILKLTKMAEVNDLMFEFGREIGNTLVPIIRALGRGIMKFRKELSRLTKQMKYLVPVMLLFIASLASMFIIATLITMFATFLAVLSRTAFGMRIVTIMNIGMMRSFAMLAVGLILIIAGLVALKYMFEELKKEVGEIDPMFVVFTGSAAATTIAIAALMTWYHFHLLY